MYQVFGWFFHGRMGVLMAYRKIFHWSKDDNAYITKVPSLPGCMADGATIEESLKNADEMIEEWIWYANEIGREIPKEDFESIESENLDSLMMQYYHN